VDYVIELVTPKPKASLVIEGVDAGGLLDVKAVDGGVAGNSIRFALTVGATGPGNENRPLRMTIANDDMSVVFATDGAGASVVPTAQEVSDLVAMWPQAGDRIVASCPMGGQGQVGTIALTNLTGGLETAAVMTIDGASTVYLGNGDSKLVSALAPGDSFSLVSGQPVAHTVLTVGAA